MVLTPWTERDPFHKEADFPGLDFVQSENDNLLDSNVAPAKPVSDQLDFESETPVLVTARPKPSTTKSTTTIIDDKLDINLTSTTNRPKKKRTTATTRRPTAIIDNKLDFSQKSTTKRHDSPFSKLKTEDSKSDAKTTARKRKRRTRATNTDKELFVNQDSATKYMNNRPIAPRLADELKFEKPESRVSYVAFERKYDNDFDFGDQPYRPSYDYGPRPSSSLHYLTTKRPQSFQNNRPNYQDTNFVNVQDSRPTNTPISSEYSTPFSYDTIRSPSSMSPQINYENMAIPLYISPNRPSYPSNYNRPTYATTRKNDLTTFFIVETTRRTTPSFIDLKRTTQRPQTFLDPFGYQNSFSSQTDDSTNFSYLSSSHTNGLSSKKPSHATFSKPSSAFSHDQTGVESEDSFDGYLRPETSFYIPFNHKPKPSYNDYSKYNSKPEASAANNVKYFYMENVLHKYYESKTNGGDRDDEGGLYDRQPTKRYAEFYDQHLNVKSSNEFVSLARTLTDRKTLDNKISSRRNDELDRPQNIFLVPFKLLTKIDRPDNWVDMTTSDDKKSQLPEVPALEQDGNVARELPKPIFGRLRVDKN